MSRTEKRAGKEGRFEAEHRRAWLRQIGRDLLLFAAVSSLLMTVMVGVAGISGRIVIVLAATLLLAGLVHLIRARSRADRNFASWWVLSALALAIFGLLASPPLAVAAVGAILAMAVAARGHKLSSTGLAAGFACTVVIAAFTCGLYCVVVVAKGVTWVAEEGGKAEDDDPDPPQPDPYELLYADLCPALPDPGEIGHGLGELFEQDGAVEAGCGGPAEEVGDTGEVFISLGMCKTELRSLAVSGEGHDPVLLYGEPAEFAWRAARAEGLRYAEVAKPGSGDLAIVTTDQGSHVFARSTPSVQPRSDKARRCDEINEMARPYVHLPPPMAELWSQYTFESGWTWPHYSGEENRFTFVFDGLEEVASGGCESEADCYFKPVDEPRRAYAGSAAVSLADVSESMPPSSG